MKISINNSVLNITVTAWTFVVVGALMLASCDSQLAIAPVNNIDATTALQNEQGVEVMLTGAYDGLSDVDVFGGQVMYNADLLGDDREVVFAGTFTQPDEIWRKTITTVNTFVRDNWRDSYIAINRTNNVLSGLSKVSMGNAAVVEGEALFIRGLVYFELVRTFAKVWGDGDNAANPGVPLVLTPTVGVSDADNRRRNSVAEVYAQVITDLTKAESLLPAKSNGYRANKAAAAAILSRVYLMQANYPAARDAANRVITSNNYALAETFEDAFTEGAPDYEGEYVFRLYVFEQDGANDLNTFFASSAFQGRGDIRIQQKHLSIYEMDDERATFFYRTGQSTFTAKHVDQFGDIPVVRIAEMYLTRAETNARLNTQVGATPANDLNLVRKRVGLPNNDAPTVDNILQERKIELAFEGHRIHDLKRTRRAVGMENLPFNSNRLVFPLPQREIDVNKNLVQNPGY
jgi:starch-binding outer membrane protein, SusD/RagB family